MKGVTRMTSTLLAGTFAAFLAPFITEWIKNKLGVSTIKSYFVSVLVSGSLAIAALAVNGELNLAEIKSGVPTILSLTQFVFMYLKTQTGLLVDIGKPVEPTPPTA